MVAVLFNWLICLAIIYLISLGSYTIRQFRIKYDIFIEELNMFSVCMSFENFIICSTEPMWGFHTNSFVIMLLFLLMSLWIFITFTLFYLERVDAKCPNLVNFDKLELTIFFLLANCNKWEKRNCTQVLLDKITG